MKMIRIISISSFFALLAMNAGAVITGNAYQDSISGLPYTWGSGVDPQTINADVFVGRENTTTADTVTINDGSELRVTDEMSVGLSANDANKLIKQTVNVNNGTLKVTSGIHVSHYYNSVYEEVGHGVLIVGENGVISDTGSINVAIHQKAWNGTFTINGGSVTAGQLALGGSNRGGAVATTTISNGGSYTTTSALLMNGGYGSSTSTFSLLDGSASFSEITAGYGMDTRTVRIGENEGSAFLTLTTSAITGATATDFLKGIGSYADVEIWDDVNSQYVTFDSNTDTDLYSITGSGGAGGYTLVVPEPATMGLVVGFAGLMLFARRTFTI